MRGENYVISISNHQPGNPIFLLILPSDRTG
nr:MAG TPA: hypothetical protein [Caudoviricetes sp.]